MMISHSLWAQKKVHDAVKRFTHAQDSIKPHESGVFVLPLIYYTPDTRWAAGAFVVYYFHFGEKLGKLDKKPYPTRLSYVKFLADYTQNLQLDVWSSWNIFTRREAWLIKGEARYRIYPDRFYGIGNRTPNSAMERYEFDYTSLKLLTLKRIHPNGWKSSIFVGPDIQYTYAWNMRVSPDGQLNEGLITGSRGGLNSGAGFVALMDSRDNVVNASRGFLLEASSYFFDPAFGGSFNYDNFNFIYNTYNRIFKSRKRIHVLATNLVMNLNSGDVPFLNLATVGNDDLLRGYPRYRFRYHNFIGGQVEYRFPIKGRFGGVGFVGGGEVFNSINEISLGSLKYSYGGGLRFMVNRSERLNIRLDYGIGLGSQSFYISMTEAF